MLYRAYYVFVIYLTLFILLIHVKPNKSELVRKSCAEFSGFLLYGIGGERTVEAAGTGQSGTRTFAEPLQRCLRSWAVPGPLPISNIPWSLGRSCSAGSAPHSPCTEGKSQQTNCKTFKMVALHFPFANSSISSVFYNTRNVKASF